MTRDEQIKEQVELAQNLLAKKYNGKIDGMNVVITANRLSARAKKEFFAFHLEPENTVNVGDILTREDRSIAKVEVIL